MRLFIKFLVVLLVLMLLVPLPPLAIVVAAVGTLYVLEYLRAKNIALKTIVEEKYVQARRRLRARLESDRPNVYDAETEEDALDIDELSKDLEAELDEGAPIDELSDTWIAKAERHRARIRRAIWRTVSWPIRKVAHLLLSLFEEDRR